MIELERHIEILLLSNDCVIVPDFGGFMAHYVEARYDEQENIFLPPQRTIGFNPQLTLNDSLLAQSYIEAYDISYPEAIRRIADEVCELKQHIENAGSYELYDLGVISINKYGKYEFEPCEAGILTPELYGLSSYDMPLLVESVTTEQQQVAERNTVISQETISEEQQSQIVSVFDDEEDEKTIRLSTLRNIAVACIAIIAFFVISSPISTGDKNITQARINTGMLLQIVPKDVVEKTSGADTTVLKNEQEYSAVSGTTVPHSTVEQPDTFYTVVLCSRVAVKNAMRYMEQLHNAGLESAEVLTQGKNTRVIFGRFDTENEAYKIASKLKDTNGFTDCWVTKIVD